MREHCTQFIAQLIWGLTEPGSTAVLLSNCRTTEEACVWDGGRERGMIQKLRERRKNYVLCLNQYFWIDVSRALLQG